MSGVYPDSYEVIDSTSTSPYYDPSSQPMPSEKEGLRMAAERSTQMFNPWETLSGIGQMASGIANDGVRLTGGTPRKDAPSFAGDLWHLGKSLKEDFGGTLADMAMAPGSVPGFFTGMKTPRKYGAPKKYKPHYARSKDPRTMRDRIFGKKPTVPEGWTPASDFLPPGTKKMEMFRGIKPMRNPVFPSNGPWLNPSYLSKAKIIAGDWITQDRALAKAYARGHTPSKRPEGPVLTRNIPIKDLYVPNEKLLNPGHGTRKPMFGPNPLDKVRYMPRGTKIDPNTGSQGGKIGLTGKERHLIDLKQAKWPEGARKPMVVSKPLPFNQAGRALVGALAPQLQNFEEYEIE